MLKQINIDDITAKLAIRKVFKAINRINNHIKDFWSKPFELKVRVCLLTEKWNGNRDFHGYVYQSTVWYIYTKNNLSFNHKMCLSVVI